jgi:hypothetical protein
MGLSRNHFQLNSGRSPVRSQLRPFSSRRFNSPVYDLDWPVPVDTDNRSRCGRSLVRCGLTSAWRCPCQAFWVVGSSARHQRRMQLRSFSPYSWSRNPSTVARWACGESAVGAAGCEASGSGSMCRWRRSAVVRIPAFRAGESRIPAFPGWRSRWSENCVTRVGRRSQRSERRNASSAEAAGGGRRQTWHRRWCPITEVVKLSRGCLKPRAMGRDSVRRSWTIAAGRQISLRQERPLHTDGKAVG